MQYFGWPVKSVWRWVGWALLAATTTCLAGATGQPSQWISPARILRHHASHGYLGVEVADVTQQQAQTLHLDGAAGAEIVLLDHDAPAGKAGLHVHDVILASNGTKIRNAEQFRELLRQESSGKKLRLSVNRDGAVRAISVQLERLQLSASVVNDADRRGEAQPQRPLANHQRVVRLANPAPHHGVDVHMELRMLGQHLQLPVQHLQALLRHLIRLNVVDRDLHVVQPRSIQPLDALSVQQIAVGNHPGQRAHLTNPRDHLVQLRMRQWLAAGDRDDARPQTAQIIDPAQHLLDRHRLRDLVVLVAVRA